jgi:NAD(P)-dependent dehydrogenase (short-subunit alcohol dehydrogenase family)
MAPKPSELAGQTALVTGGAARIGRATALALARAGANVVVHCNTSARAAGELAERIRAAGPKAWTVQADLADPTQAEALLEQARQQAGPIDILVSNAAIFPESRLTDFTAEDLAESINVNALAPLLIGRAFAAQGRPGAVVNLLDCRIVNYDRRHAAYHLSKRMLFTLTRMMALEFAPAVRVNAVAPGLILPPAGEDESYLQRRASSNPLNRHGDVEDVTAAVMFLIRSGFVTGQVLYVDGGRHMKGATYA